MHQKEKWKPNKIFPAQVFWNCSVSEELCCPDPQLWNLPQGNVLFQQLLLSGNSQPAKPVSYSLWPELYSFSHTGRMNDPASSLKEPSLGTITVSFWKALAACHSCWDSFQLQMLRMEQLVFCCKFPDAFCCVVIPGIFLPLLYPCRAHTDQALAYCLPGPSPLVWQSQGFLTSFVCLFPEPAACSLKPSFVGRIPQPALCC